MPAPERVNPIRRGTWWLVAHGISRWFLQSSARKGDEVAQLLIQPGRMHDPYDVYETLRANEMTDGVHVRLMVTRGPKSTPYQDPRFSAGPATVVIIAEHKDPLPATVETGLSLFTVHVRRASPDTLDPKLRKTL